MNWRIKIIFIAILIYSCESRIESNGNTYETDYIIEANQLQTLINRPNIKLIDFRNKEKYLNGHILNALNITRRDIQDNTFPYSGMMASREQIESLFSKLGIRSSDTVIIYDDNGMCEGSRLWWILQNYGFKKVKLLNGGISSWLALNETLTKVIPEFKVSQFELPDNSTMLYHITKEELMAHLNSNVAIIDTRTFDEYSGKYKKKGALKPGRIPNSTHIDWADNINYKGDHRLKSIEEIKKVFDIENLKNKDLIILYCHSGVRSAHSTFVLTQLLGFDNVKNYDGSWVEWSYFDYLPSQNDTYVN